MAQFYFLICLKKSLYLIIFLLLFIMITSNFAGGFGSNHSVESVYQINANSKEEPNDIISIKEDSMASFLKGKKFYFSKNYSEAFKAFNKSLSLIEKVKPRDKSEAEIWLYYGLSQLRLGHASEAIGSFDKATTNDPGLANAWINLISAQRLIGSKNYSEISLIYKNAINNTTGVSEKYNLMMDYGNYTLVNTDYNESIKIFSDATNLTNSSLSLPIFLEGVSLYNLSSYHDALCAFNKSLTIERGKPINVDLADKRWYLIGLSQYKLGRYVEADLSLDKAIKNLSKARLDKALILQKLGKNQEALNVLYKGGNITKDEYYYYLALKSYTNKNSTDADKIPEYINKSGRMKEKFLPNFLEGKYMEMINSTEALRIYEKILSNSNISDKLSYEELPWLRKAYLLMYMINKSANQSTNKKYIDGSIDSFQKALEIDPNNRDAWRSLGMVQFLMHDYSSSLDSFNKSKIYERDVLFFEGLAYKNLSENGSAIETFDKILKNNSRDLSAWNEKISMLSDGSIKKSIAMGIEKGIGNEENYVNLMAVSLIVAIITLLYYIRKRRTYSPVKKILFIDVIYISTFSYGMYLFNIIAPTATFIIFAVSLITVFIFISILLDDTSLSWRKNAEWAFKWFESDLLFSYRKVDVIFIFTIASSLVFIFASFILQKIYADDNMAYAILRFFSLLFIISSILITTKPFMNLLKSDNLERDTRDLIFFAHLGYLCLLSPYISLILWINGLYNLNTNIDILNTNVKSVMSLGQGTNLLYILSMFLLITLTLLFPYIIGETRNKKWTESLLEKRIYWLEKILDVLDYPERSDRIQTLTVISKDIETYEKEIFGEFDPRKNYIDFLKNLNDKIKLIISKFEELREDKLGLAKIADSYSEKIRSRKEEIRSVLDDEKKIKSHFYIYASLFISTILLAIVNQLISMVMSSFNLSQPP